MPVSRATPQARVTEPEHEPPDTRVRAAPSMRSIGQGDATKTQILISWPHYLNADEKVCQELTGTVAHIVNGGDWLGI